MHARKVIFTVASLFVGLVFLTIVPSIPTEAQFHYTNCHWSGTGPICKGSCPSGYVGFNRNTKGCISGHRIYCCEPQRGSRGFKYINCQWDGTRPFCKGRCMRGYVERARDSGGCISGHRAYCCQPIILR